jgi:hypothetical protein
MTSGANLTYSAVGLPAGLSIDPATGLISGTLADNADTQLSGGVYTPMLTVTDNANNQTSLTFMWTVNPVVTVIANQGTFVNSLGANLSTPMALVSAMDVNGNALTYAAVGLPDGLSIDPATGLVSGTITAAPGNYSVTVVASDTTNSAFSATTTLTWIISPIAIQNPGTQISYVGQTPSLQINGTDCISGATLTYSATGLPANFAIDPATGLISWTGADSTVTAQSGMYLVTITVTDDANNQARVAFTWLISPAVTMTSLGTQSNQVGDSLANFVQVVSATDADGNALVYTATGLPDGLIMDAATGLVSGTITADAGTYAVTVTATDAGNNAFTATLKFAWIIS